MIRVGARRFSITKVKAASHAESRGDDLGNRHRWLSGESSRKKEPPPSTVGVFCRQNGRIPFQGMQ